MELLVLQYIRDSGNMGIGLGDLKRRTSLQYPTVGAFHLFKILRNLESRQVIKKVNAQSVNRMVYMLYDLEPHRDITGTPSPTEAARPSTSSSDAGAAAGSLTALDFSSMRVRELKAYLQARRVDMNDVLERSELETLCEATRRAALGDPPRAASGRACAGPSSATTTGQPEEAGEEEKEAPPACVQCGKTEAEAREEGGKLRICSLCHAKTERYCCRECQVAHWPTHRRSCAGYERKRKKGKARE